MEWSLAIVALAVLAVASVSGRIAGSSLTPAILFVAIGVIVGPRVLGDVDLSSTGSTVRALAEATLALVLFSDASRINLGALRRGANVPTRLLGIGLPLTIALGALAAAAVFGQLSIEEAVIIGVVLAPTDAALGQAVVTDPRCRHASARASTWRAGSMTGSACPCSSSRWRRLTFTRSSQVAEAP